MKKSLLTAMGVFAAILALISSAGQTQSSSAQPQFTKDGKLVRPEGYRRWGYVSSGFGMSYNQSNGGSPSFTNVFVAPPAYEYFTTNGKWPDKTMFVLEIYGSTSRGSTNKNRRYHRV